MRPLTLRLRREGDALQSYLSQLSGGWAVVDVGGGAKGLETGEEAGDLGGRGVAAASGRELLALPGLDEHGAPDADECSEKDND